MTQDQSVRLGIIGAGFVGKVHLENFAMLPDVELGGICDVERLIADKAAQRYGVKKVFENADALIASDIIDAVVVCMPNRLHKEIAVKTLQAGKHVLLEKPMSLNAGEAMQIVEAERRSDRILMIAHHMRWQCIYTHVKSLIDKGEFGKIYYAKTGIWRRKTIPGWRSWFTRKAESGGVH